MTREYVTPASFMASINGTDMDYAAECAEHGNSWLDAIASAIADASQLEEGGTLRREAAAVARDKMLAYHYSRQGWPERAKEAGARAEAGKDAFVARIKADRPASTRTIVVSRNLAGGLSYIEPSGQVTLGLG